MLTKVRYKLVYNRSHRLNRLGEGLVEIECSQLGRRIYFTTQTLVCKRFSNKKHSRKAKTFQG